MVADGFDQYKNSWIPFFKKTHKYDGYALLASMTFENLKNAGDSLGISIDLPNGSGSDYSSFGFANLGETLLPLSSFTDGTTQEVTFDASWLCSSYPKDATKTTGYCYHFAPKKSSDSGPNYRWTAGDTIHPLGWSNVSGQFSVWDLTEGTGSTLMNALTL